MALSHGHVQRNYFCQANRASVCDYSYVQQETTRSGRAVYVVRPNAPAVEQALDRSWLRTARVAAAALIVGGCGMVACGLLVRPTIVTHLFALAVGTLFGAGMRVLDAKARTKPRQDQA